MPAEVYRPRDNVSYEQAFSALIEGRSLEELFVEKEEDLEEMEEDVREILESENKTEIYQLKRDESKEYWIRNNIIGAEQVVRLEEYEPLNPNQ